MSVREVDVALREIAHFPTLPGFVAMANWRDGTRYLQAFGDRSTTRREAMTTDTVFRIASLSKAVTSVAALQLVVEGKISLNTPVVEILPSFGKLPLLQGFDSNQQPILEALTDHPTVLHLLTHTSGLGYAVFSADIDRYMSATGVGLDAANTLPRLFKCGTRWEYGLNIDWLGELIAVVEGKALDEVLQERIFTPLGMPDTSFALNSEQSKRLAEMQVRGPDGSIAAIPYPLKTPDFLKGGGGLYSTASDYMTFLQAVVDGLLLPPDLTSALFANAIGDTVWECLPSANPAVANRYEPMPGISKRWSLGFLINTEPCPGGRAAGSGAWAGVFNCYYWLDPRSGVMGLFLSQLMPFADPPVLSAFEKFERAVYL